MSQMDGKLFIEMEVMLTSHSWQLWEQKKSKTELLSLWPSE